MKNNQLKRHRPKNSQEHEYNELVDALFDNDSLSNKNRTIPKLFGFLIIQFNYIQLIKLTIRLFNQNIHSTNNSLEYIAQITVEASRTSSQDVCPAELNFWQTVNLWDAMTLMVLQ